MPYAELAHNSADSSRPIEDFNADRVNDEVASSSVELRFTVNGLNVEGSNVTLSDIFARLANLLEHSVITDFSLTRTNLEQVFVNFAKFQIQAASEGHARFQGQANINQ
jgi:multidrug efflux pump subunit AcrB